MTGWEGWRLQEGKVDNMGVARSSVGQCNWKVVAKINKGGTALITVQYILLHQQFYCMYWHIYNKNTSLFNIIE